MTTHYDPDTLKWTAEKHGITVRGYNRGSVVQRLEEIIAEFKQWEDERLERLLAGER